MRDLLLSLSPGTRPREALEQELRTAIRSGRLRAGAALPSTRTLAADLEVSRSTVVAAYEQLQAEGYLRARQGKATVVADIAVAGDDRPDRNPLGQRPPHDFRPGEPTTGSFPRKEWQRSTRRVLAEAPDEAFGYGDPRGRVELREALAGYLARTRKVNVDAGAVRVYAGFASSLGFVAELAQRRGRGVIAVERPMLPIHRQILTLAGLDVVEVPVDDQGLIVEKLAKTDAQLVLVTPSNQQPLGVTMSSQRRQELLIWASEIDGWILEDDYDGEFRYDRNPIGALQGLDAERVIYGGTASKALGPGVHLSWLVVPRSLRRDMAAVTHLRAGVSTINQLVLADFINTGSYDRHVRQQRRLYRSRRAEVQQRLQHLSWLEVADLDAGMHLVARIIDDEVSEPDVLTAAGEAGIGLIGLQTHFEHDQPGLVINVSRPARHQFGTAVDALEELLGRFGPTKIAP